MTVKNISFAILLNIALANFYPCLQPALHVFLLADPTSKFGKKFSDSNEQEAPFWQQPFCNACSCFPGIVPTYINRPGKIYQKLEEEEIQLHFVDIKTPSAIHPSINRANYAQFENPIYVKKASNTAHQLATKIVANYEKLDDKHDLYLLVTTNTHSENIAYLVYQMINKETELIQQEEENYTALIKKENLGWPKKTYNKDEKLTNSIFYCDLRKLQNSRDNKIIEFMKAKIANPSTTPDQPDTQGLMDASD